jgi:hypothetical protein
MKIYIAQLLCTIFEFDFKVGQKLYRLPRDYAIKMYGQLISIHRKSQNEQLSYHKTTLIAKIEQVHNYYKIERLLQSGQVTEAQSLINENNDTRAEYLTQIYSDASRHWNEGHSKAA